jgi:hypothetical protein
MKRHARQTGEVVWAWNLLQAGFFHIFSALACPENRKLALSLWHSIQSDSAQRKMAVEAAKATLALRSRILANVQWLEKRASDLSPFRNDAAHVLITMGLNGKMQMDLWPDRNTARPASVDRLLKLPVAQYWRKVRGDLFSLGVYAGLHADFIRGHSPRLPDRPRLLSLQPGPRRRGKSARRSA